MGNFLSSSSRLEEFDRAHTPPAGYQPLVAYGCGFPPKGVYIDLAAWLADFGNDTLQITTFCLHGDFGFAIVCSGFIGMTLFGLWSYIGIFNPLDEARRSALRGLDTEKWAALHGMERVVEAPGTGLIAPYGMLLSGELSWLQAGSAALGLLLSTRAIAAGKMSEETTSRPDAAKCVIPPGAFKVVELWRLVAAAADLTAFAVASRVAHPSIIAAGYLLVAAANGFAEQDADGKIGAVIASILVPVLSMMGMHTNTLGLPVGDGTFKGPAWPSAVAIMARFIFWGILCFGLDLPRGLLPFSTLSRPMGSTVLHNLWQDSWRCLQNMEDACSSGMSSGSSAFNIFVMVTAMVTVPLNILIMILMLIFNPHYRNGTVDDALYEQVEKTGIDIERWAVEREKFCQEPLPHLLSQAEDGLSPKGGMQ
eukprot:TRINITY_DN906_c0_g1_i1.p1 TRINITY_DN906_c0_g1~~TRINITY_DN906_c0_g1_i1.p1  ORF type:complete len:423 (+),score=89.48 TRINITY_DN906_c0_g1_i1:63-1331(+)